MRLSPPWLDCWRDRHALKSAAVAAKMLGRSEEEDALRDAVLLTSAGRRSRPRWKAVSRHTKAGAPVRGHQHLFRQANR
nr:DUF1403 family protein [Agrobacterium fabrum]